MSIRSTVKSWVTGPPGDAERKIKHGLLKGMNFYVDPSIKSMRLVGLDEREIAAATRAAAAAVTVAMDIGANDGWYATYFAGLPNINRVYAFEPDVSIRPKMDKNLTANGPAISSKVEVVQKMVGDKDDADWVSVDSFATRLSGQKVLLKIDVDGGELDVLNGARRVLTEIECRVVMETHTAELERTCIALLESIGYRCRIIDVGWYRRFFPESRPLAHNRWFVAAKE